MESPQTHRIKGPIIHSWGPFLVRAPTIFVTEGYPDTTMTWHVVSIMLSPENEHTIGTLNNDDVSLPGLVRQLRRKLHTLEHTIETWDHHLRELQQPEGMAALQAKLDEEAARRQQDPEDADDDDKESADTDTSTAKEKRTFSATQVLANQREERQRVQSLYEAIQAGLRELEDAFPELRADHP